VQGNGDASDYAPPTDVPVESDFSKEPKKQVETEARKPIGPMNYNPNKKDTAKTSANKLKENHEADSRKKTTSKAVKENDY